MEPLGRSVTQRSIGFFAHGMSRSGAAIALLELAECVRNDFSSMTVFFPADGPLVERFEALDVRMIPIAEGGWFRRPGQAPSHLRVALSSGRQLQKVTSVVRANPLDLYVTNTLTSPWGAVACRLLSRRHAWYVHELGDPAHLDLRLGMARSAWLVGRLSTRVICNSQTTFDHLAQWIPPTKMSIVRYAMNTPRSDAPVPDGEQLRLVIVGPLTPGKRVSDAIRAAALTGASLTVVGDGPLRSRLEAEAADLRADVTFTGDVDDPTPHYVGAHALLSCSIGEAYPRVIIEAMRCGRPALGARSAGTAELIDDLATGLLFDPGDVADLARTVTKLSADIGQAGILGAEARKVAAATWSVQRYRADFLAEVARAMGPGRG